jgi:hypothetical protein
MGPNVIFDLKTLARTMSQQCTLIHITLLVGQAEVNEVGGMGCMGCMGICAAGPESWSRSWTVNDCTMRQFCDGRGIDSWRTCFRDDHDMEDLGVDGKVRSQ